MKARELENLGVPRGEAMHLALRAIADAARGGMSKTQLRETVKSVIADPAAHLNDPRFQALAQVLNQRRTPPLPATDFVPRDQPAPWKQWGVDLEPDSVQQMRNACALPVAVVGALMPDAHVGYGLPIGGVLATENAVIPYAVGVDIACRMKMTVLDVPGGANAIRAEQDRLINALERETRFGVGAEFSKPHEHPVLDEDWTVSPITHHGKRKAQSQLGTSGSGNHFVEFGTLTIEPDAPDLGLKAGIYLALLTHSGSRGTGASVADHYSKLAMKLHPELPKELKHLAWLSLDTEEGQEYWNAMNLMGKYAAANHDIIHRMIARNLRADVIADIENHHNFAWKETHIDPRSGKQIEVIVHRKGATPAGKGVLGIIPGSMASPGFVVRGKGSSSSLHSASHGAGRVMSRTKAKETFTWSAVRQLLADRDVTLLSAGIDEVPGVYKDIHQVMSQQSDLVDILGRFDPRIVKMAPSGERAED
jgi:tRNA-splicing ligase RtcB (3'-phosphate/5'-hydroxy nucleic acid ligase)